MTKATLRHITDSIALTSLVVQAVSIPVFLVLAAWSGEWGLVWLALCSLAWAILTLWLWSFVEEVLL